MSKTGRNCNECLFSMFINEERALCLRLNLIVLIDDEEHDYNYCDHFICSDFIVDNGIAVEQAIRCLIQKKKN